MRSRRKSSRCVISFFLSHFYGRAPPAGWWFSLRAGLLLRFVELVTENHTLALGGCAAPWAESWAGLFSYTPRDSGSAPVFPVFPSLPSLARRLLVSGSSRPGPHAQVCDLHHHSRRFTMRVNAFTESEALMRDCLKCQVDVTVRLCRFEQCADRRAWFKVPVPQASHALPYSLDVLTLVLPQWALRASAWCAAFATSSATTKCRARDLGQLQLYKLQQKTATTVDRTLPIGATVDGTSQPSDQYTRHTRRGLVIRSGVHTTTEVMHQATCALTFRGSDHVSGRDGRKLQRVCARRVARGAGVLEAACKGAPARRRLLVGPAHGDGGQSRHGHDCIRRRSRTPPLAVAMARRWMRLVRMVH